MTDEAVSARHYVFLGFSTLLNVMNFVDRQLLASFANFIVPDLGLTNTEFGLLTGLAFITFYVVMGLFMGVLGDIVNRPRLVAVGLTLWSALTALSGAARGFWSLAVPRGFIGVGESILTPTSLSMLADRFPLSRLGFASGFYYMGVPIGVGTSLLIVGYLGPTLGWRNCFYLLGAIGVVLAAVMWFVEETPRRHVVAVERQSRPNLRAIAATSWRALGASPALRYTILGGVFFHFILGAGAYEQLWYVHERGFERADIARITGWIGMFAGVLGNIVGGMGSDWLQRRTGMGRAMFLFWVTLLLAPTSLMFRLVDPHSIWFWLGVFFGMFQVGCFYGPTFSTVQELVPPQIRATVVAFYILTLNFVGLGIGITAAGVVIDFLVAHSVESPYTWALVAFTLLSMVSTPLFFMAGRRFQHDRQRLYAAWEADAMKTAA